MKPEPFDLQAPFDLEAQRIFALRAGGRGEQAVADLRLHQLSCQIAGDLCARLGDLRRELREGFVRVADLASHPSLPWEVAGRELSVNLPNDISLRVTDADLASLQTIPPPKARDSADKAGDKSQKPTENQGENQKENRLGKSDLVISHLSLHRQNDLPRVVAFARALLAPGGLFLASVAGPETLSCLRRLFLEAETRLYGGATPHIASFPDLSDLGRLLQGAGFALPVLERDILHGKWERAHDLMGELRALGVGNSLSARRRTMSPRQLFAEVERLWQEGDKSETFEAIYLTAWAPAEDQQQPMRPGTAKQSLTQSLGAEGQEISTEDLKKTS